MMKKETRTLYTVIEDPECLIAAIKNCYSGMTESFVQKGDRILLTMTDGTQILFNVYHQRKMAEFISSHTSGMHNYVLQVETEHEELKKNVRRLIMAFRCVLGITFYTNDNQDRTDHLTKTFFEIAKQVEGFLLSPDMKIHTKDGKLLFSDEGESELPDFVAVLPYDHLRLRTTEEMIQRAAALYTVAAYSDVMLDAVPSKEEALLYVKKMDELYNIKAYLSPNEAAYLANPSPKRNQCIQFVWRYESCGTLLWAAGVTSEFSFPSENIDIPVLSAIFLQHNSIDELVSRSIPRKKTEILDTAAITLRHHEICANRKNHTAEGPYLLNSDIVAEQMYAFCWLTGLNGVMKWDDNMPTV